MSRKYPCEGCSREPNPRQCDNKECKQWRRWFLGAWEQTRQRFGCLEMKQGGGEFELEKRSG